ncbi:MAG: ABC transporter ATP-binding protein [Desulfurococcus sp.]|jgi:ABC-2 type transport system ATP-binding protein|uniref:ABC transporter ATP-binding protein n=1 Tax=Desulfurococcus sp. TaxID=51678 RepID=UPI0031647A7A
MKMKDTALEEMNVVKFDNVTKRFGRAVVLDSVSFVVKTGTIHALLGHNGAGKTTSLRMIVGVLRPTAGRVEVFDVDPYRNPEVRMNIGYAGESAGFYGGLTVYDNLLRFCELKLENSSLCRDEIGYVADVFDLHEILDKKVNKLSAGNRQRAVIARAFIGKPKLVILDEPLNSLDPVWRTDVKKLMRDYVNRYNATILYSTHVLSDVEETADYVTILRKGKIVYHGTLSDLSSNAITARIVSRDSHSIEHISRLFLENAEKVSENSIHLSLRNMNDVRKLLSYLVDHQVDIETLEIKKVSLEDVYLKYYREGENREAR